MTNEPIRVQREIAGRTMTLETGQIARQAHGSVLLTYGESQVFAAAVTGSGRDDIDFFPLQVDYREKTEASGKIPGGFFKREGRPTTKETLTMRLIDRSIRPLFPKGFKNEVQVHTRAYGFDGENNCDVLAMIAGFASLHISPIPFACALGATRIAHVDGELVAFPTEAQRRGDSKLDLVVAGHQDAIVMVEAEAKELPEEEMIDALELAHSITREVLSMVEELREKAGQEKMEFVAPAKDEELHAAVGKYEADLRSALAITIKQERADASDAVRSRCIEELTAGIEDKDELKDRTKAIKNAFHDLDSHIQRDMILDGKRVDGRSPEDIRPISITPGFIKRQHGSALFTRGETQALASVTLGTPEDEAIIDGIDEEYRKHFYLHYNFPSFCVGETRRIMGPGRREIGHGMLAERALAGILPPHDQFPYTIRITSEILESNGSSSMASVCGGCLAMMAAGVPLRQPVAGIAMGLVQDENRTVILSDILGSEDHHGDMDFKVAGSGLGITALQMDIKIQGVTRDLLETALGQARAGRVHILRKMLEAVPGPMKSISPHAPRFETLKIPSEKIGFLIGPGGRNIKAMQEEYKVRISILDDQGNVQVFGTGQENVVACAEAIQGMCETPKIGTRYTGTIKSIKDFGAFIEILPGVEGMCHISELAEGYVDKVSDVVSMGEEVEVVVINVDDRGKIKLSRKAALVGAN